MALQLGALRDALAEAGVSKDKADKAAEEVATFDSRIAAIDSRLAVLTCMTGTVAVAAVGRERVCDLVETRGHQRATGEAGKRLRPSHGKMLLSKHAGALMPCLRGGPA